MEIYYPLTHIILINLPYIIEVQPFKSLQINVLNYRE